MTRYTIEIDDQSAGVGSEIYELNHHAAFDRFAKIEGDADPSYIVTHEPTRYPCLAFVVGRDAAQPSPQHDVEALILPVAYIYDYDRVT